MATTVMETTEISETIPPVFAGTIVVAVASIDSLPVEYMTHSTEIRGDGNDNNESDPTKSPIRRAVTRASPHVDTVTASPMPGLVENADSPQASRLEIPSATSNAAAYATIPAIIATNEPTAPNTTVFVAVFADVISVIVIFADVFLLFMPPPQKKID